MTDFSFTTTADAPSPSPPVGGRSRARAGLRGALWLLPVLAAAFAVYAGTIHDFFFLDDFWQMSQAQRAHGLDMLRPWNYSGDQDYHAYWFSAQRVKGQHEQGFFRPVVTMAYAGGLWLWGADPVYFHLVNIALHLLTIAALFWLLRRLLWRDWAAALGAAAYGLHPGHYETVGWIAANADAFMGLFGVACVAAYVEYRGRARGGRGFYILALAALALGLGSKEMAVTIPLLLAGYEVMRLGPRAALAQSWRTGWPFAAVMVGYGLWRARAAVGVYQLNAGGSYMIDLSSPLFLPQTVLNFAYFAFQAALPYPILPLNFAEALGGWCWPAAAGAAGAMALVARAVVRLAGAQAGPARFGLWWFTATLLPFCFLTPAQRIVHLPLAGWAIALAAAAVGIAQRLGDSQTRRRWAAAGATAMLIVYAGLTFSYVSVLGMAAGMVRDVTRGVESQMATLPAGSEVYLVNLWQPAWMFEHYFAVEHPKKRCDIQVLTFDPMLMNQDVLAHSQLLGKAFADFFPDQVGETHTTIGWIDGRTLRIKAENAVYFRRSVESELPVAAEAQTLHKEVSVGNFTAEATAGDARGVTELTFRFAPLEPGRKRIFLYWDGREWERIDPPGKAAAVK